MHAFAPESRLVRALVFAAILAAAPGVATAEQSVWDKQETAAVISYAPWIGIAGSEAFDVDDAFVFADPQRNLRLEADAEQVAVKMDQDRLASASDPGAPGAPQGRIALAFDSFVSLSPDGLTYASTELARGDAANARYAHAADLEPARVAMTEAR